MLRREPHDTPTTVADLELGLAAAMILVAVVLAALIVPAFA